MYRMELKMFRRTYGNQHNCNDIFVKGALSLLSQKTEEYLLNARISYKSKWWNECEKIPCFTLLWHVRVDIKEGRVIPKINVTIRFYLYM